jgi:hypothetical protein
VYAGRATSQATNLNTVVAASPRTSNIQFNPEFGVMAEQIRLR